MNEGEEVTFVAVDGMDALAFVIVRPGAEGFVEVEASARGMTKGDAADVLEQVAARWRAEVAGRG